MRILIYGLNFAPEITGVGKYTGEMAAFLAGQGHQIKVVTSYPYYPGWKIDPALKSAFYSRETWAPDGHTMQVLRCPQWVPARPTGLKRLLHLLSFAISSFPACLAQVFWKPDLVFCVAPTIFTTPAALFTAWLSGAKSWLHVQDFEIGAAWSLGMLKSGRYLRNIIEGFFLSQMRRFGRVSSISDRMLAALAEAGIPSEKLTFLPNWVDVGSIHPSNYSNGYHSKLSLDDHHLVALFSGSMTRKQSLPTVIEAARILASRTDIQFVLCGEGAVKADLQSLGSGLPNIHFLPLQPIHKLNDLLNLADIHLLPQMAASADLVLPSKLTAMLASGRPVIATTEPDTALGQIVAGAGILTPPEDATALADAIQTLASQPELRSKMGRQARRIAIDRFSAGVILPDLNDSLLRFVTV